jgi:hypothetical protein
MRRSVRFLLVRLRWLFAAVGDDVVTDFQAFIADRDVVRSGDDLLNICFGFLAERAPKVGHGWIVMQSPACPTTQAVPFLLHCGT